MAIDGEMDAAAYREALRTPRGKRINHPERALQAAIIDAARLHGWAVHWRPDWQWLAVREYAERHPWAKRFLEWSDNGFPDLVLIHPEQRRTLYVECKASGNDLSAKQKEWRDVLLAAGEDWRLWRETDWQDGAVDAVLKGTT
jgi:hypothetical protein